MPLRPLTLPAIYIGCRIFVAATSCWPAATLTHMVSQHAFGCGADTTVQSAHVCHVPPLTHCLQDLCGGNVMLASSSTNPHGFTAKVGDFGLVRTAAPAAADDSGEAVLHPVEQRLASNLYG